MTQNIATFGAQTITPGTSAQTVSTSGKYGNGNITVNAIPSNYYDINNNQVVFSYGSYGAAGALGAYKSKLPDYNPWEPKHNPPQAADIVNNGYFTGLYVLVGENGIVFRGAIPSTYRYIYFKMAPTGDNSIQSNTTYAVAVNPETGTRIARKSIAKSGTTQYEASGTLDLSGYTMPSYYWLCFYGSSNYWRSSIVTYIEVSRNPF